MARRKQTTIQLSPDTERQAAELARWWGLPTERSITRVIERTIYVVWLLEKTLRAEERTFKRSNV